MSETRQRTLNALKYAVAPAVLAIAVATVAGIAGDVPRRDLFRDPAPYLGTPLYVGVMSTLGVMVWVAGAAVALFAAALRPKRFLVEAGLFTLLFAVDDAFLLHENVLPDALHLPEELLLVAYGVLAVAIVGRAWRGLAAAGCLGLLALAAGLLGVSTVADVVGSVLRPFTGTAEGLRNYVEETTKFAGAVAWSWLLASVARDAVVGSEP